MGRIRGRPARAGDAEPVRGQILRDHGVDQRFGGRRHLHLRAGLHAGVSRGRPHGRPGSAASVFRAAVCLHGRDVRSDLRKQPDVAVSVLGNHHALLVPADRLHADGRSEAERAAGAGDEPGRRAGLRIGNRVVPPHRPAPRVAGVDRLQAIGRASAGCALVFCGYYEICTTPVLELVAGRDGGAHPGVGAAALQHDGEGGCLPGAAHGAGDHRNEGGIAGGDGRWRHFRRWLSGSHHHQRGQEGSGLVHHRQPRPDRALRRHRHLRGGLGGRIVDYFPRGGQVPVVPLRGRGGAQASQS